MIINDLQNTRGIISGLHFRLVPQQNAPTGDYIGFNPTFNQEEYGTPQTSPYGLQIRTTAAHGAIDYFPTFPFRGVRNYVGAQKYGHPVSEMLYARLRGYRGILPINELPLINKPMPYTVPAYSQFGVA
ncbi:hypothetical protein L0244_21585 [bacterium]|nr:hypothetical protein [bacterium]